MKLKEILFAMLRYEVCGETLSEEVKTACTPEAAESLYKFAKSHDLAHLVGDALVSNGLLPKENELYQKFLQQRRTAVYRCEQLDYELEQICKIFEENKIENLPLKGAILRKYYPETWMRTSCDIDILVRKENLQKGVDVLVKNGYILEGDHYHDISLYSAGGVHLELHYELIEEQDSLIRNKILLDIWGQLHPVIGSIYKKCMSDEMFLFYHIAHMVKHFIYGGCGIRPFLDLWIMERKIPYDKEKLNLLLNEGGVFVFYEKARKLAEYWFSNGITDEVLSEMEDYILNGGVYGSTENKISVKRGKKKSKFSFILSFIFLSYEQLAQIYPSLKGKKILTPFYQVRRWFRILFKGVSKKTKGTLKAYDSVTEDKQERTKKLFDTLEI